MSLIARSFSLPLSLFRKRWKIFVHKDTAVCDKWRYRRKEAPLHVRRTNLLSVALQRGFTDDSTSPSIRQKLPQSWKQFEGVGHGFACIMSYTPFFPSYFGFHCWHATIWILSTVAGIPEDSNYLSSIRTDFFFLFLWESIYRLKPLVIAIIAHVNWATSNNCPLTHNDLKCRFNHLKSLF